MLGHTRRGVYRSCAKAKWSVGCCPTPRILPLSCCRKRPTGRRLAAVFPSPQPSPPAAAVAEPNRIRQCWPSGEAYAIHAKGGFVASGAECNFSNDEGPAQIAFAFETMVSCAVESNDGRRIVETRHFHTIRTALLVSQTEPLALQFGQPSETLLGQLDAGRLRAGCGTASAPAVAAAILSEDALQTLDESATRAFLEVDSLSGKKARIVYVDGQGVESIEAIECELTSAECEYLMTTPVLWDAYFTSTPQTAAASDGGIDADQIAGLLAPGMRWRWRGEMAFEGPPGDAKSGERIVGYRIRCDDQATSAALHTSVAVTMRYAVSGGRISIARLAGPANAELPPPQQAQSNRLLDGVRLPDMPTLDICYERTPLGFIGAPSRRVGIRRVLARAHRRPWTRLTSRSRRGRRRSQGAQGETTGDPPSP